MIASQFNLTIALLIYTTKPVTEITQVMGLIPTHTQMHRDCTTEYDENSESNIWIFHKRYQKVTDIDLLLQGYFDHIPDYLKKIKIIKQHSRCVLRLSVVSLYGQIGLSLSPQDLHILNKLNIPFEISILSYGNCVYE